MRTIGRPGKKTYVPCLRIELPGSFIRAHIIFLVLSCGGSLFWGVCVGGGLMKRWYELTIKRER